MATVAASALYGISPICTSSLLHNLHFAKQNLHLRVAATRRESFACIVSKMAPTVHWQSRRSESPRQREATK